MSQHNLLSKRFLSKRRAAKVCLGDRGGGRAQILLSAVRKRLPDRQVFELTGSILKCVTEHPGFSFQVFDKLWPECQRLNSHQRDVVMRRRCLPGKAELSMDVVSWGKPPTVVHSAKLPRQYWNRTSASRNCHQRRCSAREQEVPPSSYSHTEQRRLWDSIAWVSNIRPSCGWNVQCWSDWRHCSQNKVHVFLRQLARRIFTPEVRVSLQVQVWAE